MRRIARSFWRIRTRSSHGRILQPLYGPFAVAMRNLVGNVLLKAANDHLQRSAALNTRRTAVDATIIGAPGAIHGQTCQRNLGMQHAANGPRWSLEMTAQVV
jgi:hypothetical protein